MPISKLNEDCIIFIIEELYDDINSLFSCLLVNRIWCKVAVPILWRDPWKFLKVGVKVLDRADKFFNIILLHLSEESRNCLKKHHIDISLQKRPLFNYIHFIKYIRHQFFGSGWYPYLSDIYKELYSKHSSQRKILEQEIYKLFISKCSSIKLLDIMKVKKPLYKYPGAETSLSNLCELHCNSEDNTSLFFGLAQICRMIEKFYLYQYSISNPGLDKLIAMQQKIKYLKIREIRANNNEDHKMLCKRAIMKQAHHLLYLDISIHMNLTFLNDLLSKSINLQRLILSNSELTIYISFNHYQDHSESLQIIWGEFMHYFNYNILGQINETISQHDLKIKYIEFLLSDQEDPRQSPEKFEKFEQILINCQNLEGLIIHQRYSLDISLDILCRSASTNVYKIQLLQCFNRRSDSKKWLEQFFNNWRGRKPMLLYLDDHKASFANLIEKYMEEGVIKKYVNTRESIFDDFDEFLDDECGGFYL